MRQLAENMTKGLFWPAASIASVFMDAPFAIAVFDQDMAYLGANTLWAFYHNTTTDALIGADYLEDRSTMPEHWRRAQDRALAGEVVHCDAERHVRSSGEPIWLRWACFPWYDMSGDKRAIGGIVVIVEDVTNEIDLRQENNLALERLRLALEAGHQALWELHPESDTARLLYDFTRRSLPLERVPGTISAFIGIVHPYDAALVQDAFDELIEGKRSSFSQVFRVAFGRKDLRWLHLQCLTVRTRGDGKADLIIGIHTDITEQRLQDEATIKEKERLEFALEGAADGLWDWNLQTGEIYVSPRWLEQLGYRPGEVTVNFAFWKDIIHPEDHASVIGRAVARREGATREYQRGVVAPFSYEYRLRRKDGRFSWFLSRGQTVAFDEDGQPLRVVGTHTDISERKRMEQDLIAARDVAEEANRAKSAFIANMSHEIRTPLTGVIGMLDLMSDTKLNEEQDKLISVARSSADSLLAVVNNVLDLSRLEAGRVEQRQRRFAVKALVDEVVAGLTVKAEQKNIQLTHMAGPWTEMMLYGDADRVRQILFNLVGNAIKFTKVGSVIVSSAVEPNRWGKVTLSISVADTGIGIPLDVQPHIFERFRQADDSLVREHDGSGLGLAIAKEVVELLGGAIGFSSQPGVGSRFWFDLPMEKAEDLGEQTTEKKKSLSVDKQTPRRVLLAEDNEVNQLLITSLLEKRGHEVVVAENGEVALEKLEKEPFDVILMDVQMPKLDGLSATRRIRKMEGDIANIPIIALTAHAMADQHETYQAAGMTGFVSKPIDPFRLFKAVEG